MANKKEVDIFDKNLEHQFGKTEFIKCNIWSWFLQCCWNYERMQHYGFLLSVLPALRKLYPNKEDSIEAMRRHGAFFNTQPFMAAPIIGVVLSLEEKRANLKDPKEIKVIDETIQNVKIGMMGPFAGVGDPVFWGTLRPIIGAFSASLATSGSILGPILFFLLWNIVVDAFMYLTQRLGYVQSSKLVDNLSGGLLQLFSKFASVIGVFVMGVLVPRWTTMNFVLPVSTTRNENYVDISKTILNKAGEIDPHKLENLIENASTGDISFEPTTVKTLQEVLDSLIPGLMPLLLLFLVMFLLKKNWNPTLIICLLFVFGIFAAWIGLMG